MRISSGLASIIVGVCVTAATSAWQDDPQAAQSSPIYDHHLHVMSPQLIAHWKSIGVPFSREDAAYSDPLKILESQNLAGAFLVSMAHLYTTDDLAGVDQIGENEKIWVQKENDFVAGCVRQSPTQFVGFYSVNPLRDYAIEEMNRCRSNYALTGLKLHFPACNVELTNPEHLEKVKQVFDWAVEFDVPLLVHVFGAAEEDPQALADLFWKELIQPRQSIEINLAHLGAAGGFNDMSQAMLTGFDGLLTANPMFQNARIRFDLSGAILAEETDGIPATSDDRCRDLSRLIQKIGIKKFRFASDYPVFSVQATRNTLRKKLSLGEDELQTLLSGSSRWFSIKREIAEIKLPQIRRELLRRAARDQKARRGITGKNILENQVIIKQLQQVDKENREWLAGLVDSHGWLGASLVGSDGAHSAWLLVQHADADRVFQRKCLDLMIEMAPNEVIHSNVAYLTDRVLLAEKKPQRYGTQFGMKDGQLSMQNCEDPDNLNQRRESVGLGTIEEYQELIEAAYRGKK